MAIYAHEKDTVWKELVEQFVKTNKREPNDLDKMVLTTLWNRKVDDEPF